MEPVKLEGNKSEEVEPFTYLGRIIDKHGGTDADVKARIGKAGGAFIQQFNNIWSSKMLSSHTNIHLFNSNLKSVLLYAAEMWRTSNTNTKKVQTFINHYLRRIAGQTPSVTATYGRKHKHNAGDAIRRRQWGRIGHTLQKPASAITRQALTWNQEGKGKRGRPINTWRRDLLTNTKRTGYSWREL